MNVPTGPGLSAHCAAVAGGLLTAGWTCPAPGYSAEVSIAAL